MITMALVGVVSLTTYGDHPSLVELDPVWISAIKAAFEVCHKDGVNIGFYAMSKGYIVIVQAFGLTKEEAVFAMNADGTGLKRISSSISGVLYERKTQSNVLYLYNGEALKHIKSISTVPSPPLIDGIQDPFDK